LSPSASGQDPQRTAIVEFHAGDNLGPTDQPLSLALQGDRDVPRAGSLVATSDQEALAVWVKSDRIDPALVRKRGTEGLTGGRVPESGHSVVATCQEPQSVWTKGDGTDFARVHQRRAQGQAGDCFPALRRAVAAAGQHDSAIGAESDRLHPAV